MVGQTVAHYKILRSLGMGGMGEIFLAEDTKLRCKVALKFISESFRRDERSRRRLIHEARAAAALDHPYICHINDVCETDDGRDFIVMEYVEGESLKTRLARGRLPLEDSLRIARELAEALELAHSKGIVHSDIKPSNIMLTQHGHVKIIDFGVARRIKHSGQATDDWTTTLKDTETTGGTILYMSPEHFSSQSIDHRSDIFSFGVMLYEMISDAHPFAAGTPRETVIAIISKDPPPLERYFARAPGLLKHTVAKMLAKDPDQRYQSVHEVRTNLAEIGRNIAPSSIVTKVLGLLVVLLAVASGTVWLTSQSCDHPLPAFRPLQITKADSWEGEPVLSPDGGRVAYTSNLDGNLEVLLVDSGGGSPLNLTNHPARDSDPDWFPDASAIAFASDRGGHSGIWRVSQTGGDATLLVPDGRQPAVSPDGRRIAFVRTDPKGESRIAVAELSDPSAARLITGDTDGLWDHSDPAWSPDGSLICYGSRHNLWIVSPAGGDARPLTTQGEYDFEPAWSPDGEVVYFASQREGITALWRVSVGSGEVERVSLGTGLETHPHVSGEGQRLVYATGAADRVLLIRDMASGEESLLSDFNEDVMPSIANDKQFVVFVSRRWGESPGLAVMGLDGITPAGPPHRVAQRPGQPSHPSLSNDGRWIAYYLIEEEARDIWIVSSSDAVPVRFTKHPSPDYHPAWSPDDSKLVFISERSGSPLMWVAPVDEGRPAGPPRLLDTGGEVDSARAPEWSPDGSQIAFIGFMGEQQEVWTVSTEGEAEVRQLTRGANARRIRWEGSTGYLLVSGFWGEPGPSVRRLSAMGGEARELDPPVWLGPRNAYPNFDLSADGQLLLYNREDSAGDLWMLQTVEGSF